jgi:DNA-binding transcriptional LysR family regulator
VEHLAALRIFAQVVEAKGFAAAARGLGISKAQVSKQVARLERDLGVKLLHRTTRRLSLTEAGSVFYEGCQRAIAEVTAAEAAVASLTDEPRGRLRVSAPLSFGLRHLAPALESFMARYPNVRVDLSLNDRRVDLVEEGFDIGLRIGAPEDSSLIARRLAGITRVLAAASGYLDREGRPRSPADLKDHRHLLYSNIAHPDVLRLVGPSGVHRQVKVSGALSANNGDILLSAASAGLGITFIPSFILGDAVRDGVLERVLPGWTGSERVALYCLFPPDRHMLPKLRVFMDFLADWFGDPPYWDEGLGLA